MLTVKRSVEQDVPVKVLKFEWCENTKNQHIVCNSCGCAVPAFNRYGDVVLVVEGDTLSRWYRLCETCGIKAEQSMTHAECPECKEQTLAVETQQCGRCVHGWQPSEDTPIAALTRRVEALESRLTPVAEAEATDDDEPLSYAWFDKQSGTFSRDGGRYVCRQDGSELWFRFNERDGAYCWEFVHKLSVDWCPLQSNTAGEVRKVLSVFGFEFKEGAGA